MPNPSYPRIDGQLDVFEVLDLVAQEGLVPEKPEDILDHEVFFPEGEPDDGLRIERGPAYSFWVFDADGKKLHDKPFWSMIECWAFMVGYRRHD